MPTLPQISISLPVHPLKLKASKLSLILNSRIHFTGKDLLMIYTLKI